MNKKQWKKLYNALLKKGLRYTPKAAEEKPAGEKLCGMKLRVGKRIDESLWKNGYNCAIFENLSAIYCGIFKIEENDCMTCKHFVSFREDYYDPLEPETQGFCHCSKSPYWYNEGAGAGKICKYYKAKKDK